MNAIAEQEAKPLADEELDSLELDRSSAGSRSRAFR